MDDDDNASAARVNCQRLEKRSDGLPRRAMPRRAMPRRAMPRRAMPRRSTVRALPLVGGFHGRICETILI
jgi:hypothetical protein